MNNPTAIDPWMKTCGVGNDGGPVSLSVKHPQSQVAIQTTVRTAIAEPTSSVMKRRCNSLRFRTSSGLNRHRFRSLQSSALSIDS
jgi:hypothetical protein